MGNGKTWASPSLQEMNNGLTGESVLFCSVDPVDWTWVIRPGSKQRFLLDHLASPIVLTGVFPVNGIIMCFDDLENPGSSYMDYSNTNTFYYLI